MPKLRCLIEVGAPLNKHWLLGLFILKLLDTAVRDSILLRLSLLTVTMFVCDAIVIIIFDLRLKDDLARLLSIVEAAVFKP